MVIPFLVGEKETPRRTASCFDPSFSYLLSVQTAIWSRDLSLVSICRALLLPGWQTGKALVSFSLFYCPSVLEQTAVTKLKINKAEPKYCLYHPLLSLQPGSTIHFMRKITQIPTKYFRYKSLLRYKSLIRHKNLLDFVAKVQNTLQVTDI